jgi:hypothetical protein
MAHIGVALRAEDGTRIRELEDGGVELFRLLMSVRDDVAYPYLRFVDPIDTTVFTSFQMSALVPELRRLAVAKQSAVLRTVLEIAELCETMSHSQLAFEGD